MALKIKLFWSCCKEGLDKFLKQVFDPYCSSRLGNCTNMMHQKSILGDWVSSQSISIVTWNANFSKSHVEFCWLSNSFENFILTTSVIKSTSLSQIRSVCPDWVCFLKKTLIIICYLLKTENFLLALPTKASTLCLDSL